MGGIGVNKLGESGCRDHSGIRRVVTTPGSPPGNHILQGIPTQGLTTWFPKVAILNRNLALRRCVDPSCRWHDLLRGPLRRHSVPRAPKISLAARCWFRACDEGMWLLCYAAMLGRLWVNPYPTGRFVGQIWTYTDLSMNIDEYFGPRMMTICLPWHSSHSFRFGGHCFLHGALAFRICCLLIHKGSFIEGTIQKQIFLLRPTLPKSFRRDKYPDHHTWFQLWDGFAWRIWATPWCHKRFDCYSMVSYGISMYLPFSDTQIDTAWHIQSHSDKQW